MSRRILIALPVVLVVGLAFSVQSAMAIKVGDPGFAAVQTSSKPILSEKLAGLLPATHAQLVVPAGVNMTPAQYQSLALRSEGLDRLYGSVNTVSSSRPVASEISTGLPQPSSHFEPVTVSTDDSFNWSDAGIGAGALFGTMLVGAAGALTLRRHRGTLAH